MWSNSSRCKQESVYLSRLWCLYTWSCLDNLIIIRFSINCSAVICSPTVIHAILREATSDTYGPRVSFLLYYFSSTCQSLSPFVLQSLLSNLYNKNTKIFTLLSLLDLTFASDCEGMDNLCIELVARFLIVCAGTRWLVCHLLLDWYLGSQKLREILTLLCCITLSFSRETNACSRGSSMQKLSGTKFMIN